MLLGLAVSSAAYHGARPAARAAPHHGARDTLSCRHRAVTACEPPGAEPPVLDERQAAIMKAQGYQWDAERRRWYRGDPTRRVRAECRSGGRFIRFVDADGETATGCSPAVTAAVERFASVVQTAREESVSVDREADLDFKNRLSSKLAPVAWLGLQALTLGAAQLTLTLTLALTRLTWTLRIASRPRPPPSRGSASRRSRWVPRRPPSRRIGAATTLCAPSPAG